MGRQPRVDTVFTRQTCLRYIVKYVTEGYPRSHYMDYTIHSVEGDLIYGEVDCYGRGDYNTTEFIVPYSQSHDLGGAYYLQEIYESKQDAENAANAKLNKTYEELKAMLERIRLR